VLKEGKDLEDMPIDYEIFSLFMYVYVYVHTLHLQKFSLFTFSLSRKKFHDQTY